MDLATIIGLVLAWGAFLGSILIEGGDIAALVNPSAACWSSEGHSAPQ